MDLLGRVVLLTGEVIVSHTPTWVVFSQNGNTFPCRQSISLEFVAGQRIGIEIEVQEL